MCLFTAVGLKTKRNSCLPSLFFFLNLLILFSLNTDFCLNVSVVCFGVSLLGYIRAHFQRFRFSLVTWIYTLKTSHVEFPCLLVCFLFRVFNVILLCIVRPAVIARSVSFDFRFFRSAPLLLPFLFIRTRFLFSNVFFVCFNFQ